MIKAEDISYVVVDFFLITIYIIYIKIYKCVISSASYAMF